MIELVQWAVGALCATGVGTMVCRINHMSPNTKPEVVLQHIVLAIGFFAVPVVAFIAQSQFGSSGAEWSLLVILVAIFVYLLLGSHRWRYGAPAGTIKP